jgi:hypothetical protein
VVVDDDVEEVCLEGVWREVLLMVVCWLKPGEESLVSLLRPSSLLLYFFELPSGRFPPRRGRSKGRCLNSRRPVHPRDHQRRFRVWASRGRSRPN